MRKLVFLLEEPSMKELLDILLPKLLPPAIGFMTIPHEGKQDLEKSIPRKLRAWREPGVRFVIVRDRDSADCIRVKNELYRICVEAGRADSLVRIVCNELESWFLGDLVAVASAFNKPKVSRLVCKEKFRDPDAITNAAQEIKKIIPAYQKILGARSIAKYLDPKRNTSCSFHVFIEGVRRLVLEFTG